MNHGDSLGACDSDVDIISPEITSGTTGTDLDENSGSGQTIYTIIANDDVAVTSYAIAGTDVSLLSVNTSTGVVSLITDPDYETKNSYSFTVTASDAAGNTSDPTTVSFSINDINETTLAVADTATVAEDASLTSIDVITNDTDVDGDDLTLTAVSTTSGTVAINGVSVDYTPAANFNGEVTITYTVSDGTLTDEGTLTVTVTSVNDAPTITSSASFTAE